MDENIKKSLELLSQTICKKLVDENVKLDDLISEHLSTIKLLYPTVDDVENIFISIVIQESKKYANSKKFNVRCIKTHSTFSHKYTRGNIYTVEEEFKQIGIHHDDDEEHYYKINDDNDKLVLVEPTHFIRIENEESLADVKIEYTDNKLIISTYDGQILNIENINVDIFLREIHKYSSFYIKNDKLEKRLIFFESK